jgi:hypothetical protein
MDRIEHKKLRRRWMTYGLAGAVVIIGVLFYQWRANSIVGPWTDANGKRLPDGTSDARNGFPLVIHTFNGDGHCDWESVVFLHISWPPGTVYGPVGDDSRAGRFRQYVRDPNGALGNLARHFDPNASLPRDARPTGLHRGPWELWISPAEAERAVYLLKDGQVERWPRPRSGRLPILCA